MTGDRFLIITGLSGSGKTVVSRFLEDLGYYCVDNLPATLIPSLINLWRRRELAIEKVALVVDIREHGFLTMFPRIWEDIRKKAGPKLIFLDATDETLVKRFSESAGPSLARRRSVLEGVRLERRRLAGIKKMADEVIDTSQMSIVQLKETLARRFERRRRPPCMSSSSASGTSMASPWTRTLSSTRASCPIPFMSRICGQNGKSRKVRDFVLNAPETKAFLAELQRFLGFLMPASPPKVRAAWSSPSAARAANTAPWSWPNRSRIPFRPGNMI